MMLERTSETALQLPNLVMVGLGKSGTTSLFYYLSQHPDVCPSDIKEIRYFRRKDGVYQASETLSQYAAHFRASTGERYRLEASPQYFHGGDQIIAALRETLGEPKILITLRNPVDRMWSTYRSAKARRFLPADLTFETYVDRCRQVYDQGAWMDDDASYRALAGGFYTADVRRWLDAFGNDATVVWFERMATAPETAVVEVCRWLELDTSCAREFDYSTQNETRPSRNFLVHRIAVAANSERALRSHRRLKAPLRRAYYALNGTRSTERMEPAMRSELERTFAESNRELRAELAGRGYTAFPDWLAG